MRCALILVSLACLAHPVAAQTISAEMGVKGITSTATRLAGATTPEDLFALGALRFLGAIEAGLQARWQMGVPETMMMLPVMRLPIPENPTPTAFDPGMISALFTGISAQMDAAREPLSKIPADADFGLEVAFKDIWFDIDANGTRDPGEDAAAILGPMFFGWEWDARDPALPLPVIRFDAADAAWLSAYTHLLQGTSDVILAYDPTAAIQRVIDTRTAFGLSPGQTMTEFYEIDAFADILSVVMGALDQPPDAARLTAAHGHYLAMVSENRRFWTLVKAETDNAQEWVPNDRQQSAMGIPLPAGSGDMWLAVLSDAEAMLQGKALIPYWRADAAHGINLGRMFTDPAPIDLFGWFQGFAAVPYLEPGRTVSAQNWMAFEQMMASDALLFTLFLN